MIRQRRYTSFEWMPSKLKDIIIEVANNRGPRQPKPGWTWCGKWPFTKTRILLCRAYHLSISGLFTTQISIKKSTLEITEPCIRTPHMAPWRERYRTVTWKLHHFLFILPWVHPIQPYTSSLQSFCPKGPNKHRKGFLHIGGTKNITKTGWQNSAPKQWCCSKVRCKPEELSIAKTAVHNLKSNLGSFHTHHQS